ALFGVAQHQLDLLTRYARKPFQEFINPSAAFEVLKQRLHRHARALEQPRAADLSGRAFHGWAFAPIKHAESYEMAGPPARPAPADNHTAATQSISTSNGPCHGRTQTKPRAGGSAGKYRAYTSLIVAK